MIVPLRGQLSSPYAYDPVLYHETAVRINDLVHTKLDVRFDFKKRYLYGKEWVTLRPHMYPTDSLILDAKGMEIRNVSIMKKGNPIPLKFTYDNRRLKIKLDKVYQNTDSYIVFIDYIAKPDELRGVKKNGKGLYFINPDSAEKDKPTQLWTEGEPEGSSVWFPTIDKPNQKTTQEISMTVPDKFVTLSNGRLASQKMNSDGTRTDTWKMELPNSPYLFMMAAGDFKIHKDNWKGKEVSYYLEPKYAPYAKEIFGETPEVIEFFSNITGMQYPWNKYSQIVVRDYVSGAMENTTAAVFGESMQGTIKELADRYYNTGIAHELSHQWFGDYVTCESWSNLTLNESLGVYAEYLWLEYKYGKDVADAHNFEALHGYLKDKNEEKKPLVRFQYKEIQEVFDGVTYQKGGCIINMLRNYIGKDAFYKGLNIYLKDNAFKAAESTQLRLAFEEASGLDLNWFFNQWYFGAGHPDLDISYSWDENAKTQTIYLKQTQEGKAFILPVNIDFYAGNKAERRNIWMRDKTDTLTYKFPAKPDLVNFDADKVLIAKITDNKTLPEFGYQYFNAPLFEDRYEAIEAALEKQNEKDGQKILLAALKDKYYGNRIKTINGLDTANAKIINSAVPVLRELTAGDENNLVKAAAITFLGKLKQDNNISIFEQSLKTESYAVQGASLVAIGLTNPGRAMKLAREYENDSKHQVSDAILILYCTYGGNEQWNYIYELFSSLKPPKRFNIIESFASLTGRVENPVFAKRGITAIKELGILGKQFGVSGKVIELLKEVKKRRTALNDDTSARLVDEAIGQIGLHP